MNAAQPQAERRRPLRIHDNGDGTVAVEYRVGPADNVLAYGTLGPIPTPAASFLPQAIGRMSPEACQGLLLLMMSPYLPESAAEGAPKGWARSGRRSVGHRPPRA